MITLYTPKFEYNHNEPVLCPLKIEIEAGSITTLLGSSGCGKSTLLRLLAGFETSNFSANTTFSYVPQTPHLFPWKTVFENIALNASIENNNQNIDIKTEVLKKIELVGLQGYENKYPFEISVGMAQRVSFARAMMKPSNTLLLDEPFAALDAITRRELQQWLLEYIQTEKKSVIFVTHDIYEALSISKRIYILSKKPAQIKAYFIKDDSQFKNTQTGEILSAQNFYEHFVSKFL